MEKKSCADYGGGKHERFGGLCEKTGKYEGVYHVLHGAISPHVGNWARRYQAEELVHRLEGEVEEVIVATRFQSGREKRQPYVYQQAEIKPMGVKSNADCKQRSCGR